MKYYKIGLDMSRENDVICHSTNGYGMDISIYCRALEEKKPSEDFQFHYDLREGTIFTDMLVNDQGWFVVSRRFKEAVLEKINCKIQYYSVPLQCADGFRLDHDYFIANILSLTNAFCLEGSDYSVFHSASFGRPFYSVKKYCIFAEAVGNLDLFKLSGDDVISVFCSERLKKLCEQNEITGIHFLPIRQV